jgi:hypothetical protein
MFGEGSLRKNSLDHTWSLVPKLDVGYDTRIVVEISERLMQLYVSAIKLEKEIMYMRS